MGKIGAKVIVKRGLVWRKFITVHSDGYSVDVVHQTKDEFINNHKYWKIESLYEVRGNPNDEKCTKCHKKFAIGDKVVKLDFTIREIVFMDKHLAYFGEVYTKDDGLDTYEQCRYLVHAEHVSTEQITEYQKGELLWEEGMRICEKVKSEVFNRE